MMIKNRPSPTAGGRRAPYLATLIALILLFNPNFFIVDPLPDLIAFALLSALLRHAADCAPYFEEARGAIRKLFWIQLLKLPALLLVFAIKSKNTLDNDTVALVSLIFAVADILYSCIAVRYLFDALFRLGERTDAHALIATQGQFQPEYLRSLSYLFVTVKSLCAFLPNLLLLTHTTQSGTHTLAAYGSRYYPAAVAVATLLSLLIGTVWLIRMLRYVRAIHREGLFFTALDALAAQDTGSHVQKQAAIRTLRETLLLLPIATLFTLEVTLSDLGGNDLLPAFLFGLIATLFVLRLRRLLPPTRRVTVALWLGSAYTVVSLSSYLVRASFLSQHRYTDMAEVAVQQAYRPVEVMATLECLLAVAYLVALAALLSEFARCRVGISPHSDRYLHADLVRHREWRRRSVTLAVLGILTVLLELLNTLRRGLYIAETAVRPDGGEVTIASTLLPWLPIPLIVAALIFIGYAWYYSRSLVEDAEIKITEELP